MLALEMLVLFQERSQSISCLAACSLSLLTNVQIKLQSWSGPGSMLNPPHTVLSLTSPCSDQPHHLDQRHQQWLQRNECKYHTAMLLHMPLLPGERIWLPSVCAKDYHAHVPTSVYFPSLCFLFSLGGCDSEVPRRVHHKRMPGMDDGMIIELL